MQVSVHLQLKELAKNQSIGALVNSIEITKVETLTVGEILASIKQEMSQVPRGTVRSPTIVIPLLSSNEDKLLSLWTTISRQMEILDQTMRNQSPKPYSIQFDRPTNTRSRIPSKTSSLKGSPLLSLGLSALLSYSTSHGEA